ncbi:MAG TPA: D-Ala-D-Ala carboxypeptidase family metallohydrolase [Myxococcota bacterium]|nr:D-Ala-D-Ala carboxypeptidase family metallohydrolase [Myxococcota bacterium]
MALWVSAAASARADGGRFWDGDATRARFALRQGGLETRLRVWMAAVLPGGELEISALDRAGATLPLELSGARGLHLTPSGVWRLKAPRQPGVLRLRAVSRDAKDEIDLRVFVLVPRARVANGRLNGYEIGAYKPSEVVQGTRLDPPAGFIELTHDVEAELVSPHFHLGQFACKESPGYPRYLVIDPRLVAKLEALLDALHARGIAAESLTVMSGYRTPAYNKSIGNHTDYSRHLYGEAADVFVDDSPRDGKMDDRDGSGAVDAHDAELVFGIADALDRRPSEDWTVGGAGFYAATDAHGPFVHVDVRGRAARW